ncbi:hypothetical protein PT273_04415 [Orbaceae bacterium ESL0727]|nr:hypothetical protein [Orbaceae bacterium ESL0727]
MGALFFLGISFQANAALSTHTTQNIQGTPPYFTTDGGQTKITQPEGLLTINVAGQTYDKNNTSSPAKPIILPQSDTTLENIKMLLPFIKDTNGNAISAINFNDLLKAPYAYWGDDEGDGQGENGITATGKLTVKAVGTGQYGRQREVNRAQPLDICDGPFKVDISNEAILLKTQYGLPNTASYPAMTSSYYVNLSGICVYPAYDADSNNKRPRMWDAAGLTWIRLGEGWGNGKDQSYNHNNNPSTETKPIVLPIQDEAHPPAKQTLFDDVLTVIKSYDRDKAKDGTVPINNSASLQNIMGANMNTKWWSKWWYVGNTAPSGVTVIGDDLQIKATRAGSTEAVALNAPLEICGKPYALTLSSNGGKITANDGPTRYTTFAAKSTTYYITPSGYCVYPAYGADASGRHAPMQDAGVLNWVKVGKGTRDEKSYTATNAAATQTTPIVIPLKPLANGATRKPQTLWEIQTAIQAKDATQVLTSMSLQDLMGNRIPGTDFGLWWYTGNQPDAVIVTDKKGNEGKLTLEAKDKNNRTIGLQDDLNACAAPYSLTISSGEGGKITAKGSVPHYTEFDGVTSTYYINPNAVCVYPAFDAQKKTPVKNLQGLHWIELTSGQQKVRKTATNTADTPYELLGDNDTLANVVTPIRAYYASINNTSNLNDKEIALQSLMGGAKGTPWGNWGYTGNIEPKDINVTGSLKVKVTDNTNTDVALGSQLDVCKAPYKVRIQTNTGTMTAAKTADNKELAPSYSSFAGLNESHNNATDFYIKPKGTCVFPAFDADRQKQSANLEELRWIEITENNQTTRYTTSNQPTQPIILPTKDANTAQTLSEVMTVIKGRNGANNNDASIALQNVIGAGYKTLWGNWGYQAYSGSTPPSEVTVSNNSQLTITASDRLNRAIGLTDALNACDAPYKLTISNTAGTITASGSGVVMRNTPFSAGSTTYYIKPNSYCVYPAFDADRKIAATNMKALQWIEVDNTRYTPDDTSKPGATSANPINLPIIGQSAADIKTALKDYGSNDSSLGLDKLIGDSYKAKWGNWGYQGDTQPTGVAVTGRLNVTVTDKNGNPVDFNDRLYNCTNHLSPYQLTISNERGKITANEFAKVVNYTNFDASSTTYYLTPKPPTTITTTWAQPNLAYNDVNYDGSGSNSWESAQFDSSKGFRIQSTTNPAVNFPTTAANGLFFNLPLEGHGVAWCDSSLKVIKEPANSGLNIEISNGGTGKIMNVAKVTIKGPKDGASQAEAETAVPTTFKIMSNNQVVYSFKIAQWFIAKRGADVPFYGGAFNYCRNTYGNKYSLPTVGNLTNANGIYWTSGLAGQPNHYKRQIGGGIFAEWGYTVGNAQPRNGSPAAPNYYLGSDFDHHFHWTVNSYDDKRQRTVDSFNGFVGFQYNNTAVGRIICVKN